MSLVPVDTSNAVAVSDYLSKAREWLATAVEMTGPQQIAAAAAAVDLVNRGKGGKKLPNWWKEAA